MKQIKFRAWNKNIKLMGEIIHFSFNTHMIVVKTLEEFYWDADDCEIMQSTRVRDKNGKEIYEGYIYKHYGKQRVVESVLEFGHTFFEYIINEDNIEVIGNIYENPELLENN